jgi:hypothetical protein
MEVFVHMTEGKQGEVKGLQKNGSLLLSFFSNL